MLQVHDGDKPASETPAVVVDSLTKTFRTALRSHRALNNVSLQIQPGEMVGLIGASGSGKSTLLRHLSGLVSGDSGSGQMRVLGQNVQENGKLARDIRAT